MTKMYKDFDKKDLKKEKLFLKLHPKYICKSWLGSMREGYFHLGTEKEINSPLWDPDVEFIVIPFESKKQILKEVEQLIKLKEII